MKIIKAFCIFSIFFLPSFVLADDADVLYELLQKYETIEGSFRKVQKAEDGEVIEITENKIYLRRPGLLRLHTLPPFEQVIVTNRETLWEYDPEFQEVIIRPYDQQLEQSPAALLSGNIEAIRNHFIVTRNITTRNIVATNTAATAESAARRIQFTLTPISDEQGIEKLEIHFEDGIPIEIVNYDSLGQTVSFQFSDLIVNKALEDRVFIFETPPGVDEVIADG